jgi:hypothetical protein
MTTKTSRGSKLWRDPKAVPAVSGSILRNSKIAADTNRLCAVADHSSRGSNTHVDTKAANAVSGSILRNSNGRYVTKQELAVADQSSRGGKNAFDTKMVRIPPTELPGLEAVCTELGVKNKEPHSAMGDAAATADCFRKLINKATDE